MPPRKQTSILLLSSAESCMAQFAEIAHPIHLSPRHFPQVLSLVTSFTRVRALASRKRNSSLTEPLRQAIPAGQRPENKARLSQKAV
jgi:hypothetical protein